MVCRKVKVCFEKNENGTGGRQIVAPFFFVFLFLRQVCISPVAPSAVPATPPRSPENRAGRVKNGELSGEYRMGMALQIALIMHPGETLLRPGVAIAIATEYLYGVGKRQTVELRSVKRTGRQSNLTSSKKQKIVECNQEQRNSAT